MTFMQLNIFRFRFSFKEEESKVFFQIYIKNKSMCLIIQRPLKPSLNRKFQPDMNF